MQKSLFISAFILLCIISSFKLLAQPIQNLNFEQIGFANPEQPPGWLTQWVGYKVLLDSGISHSGSYSLKIQKVRDQQSGYGIAKLNIPGELVRGKHIRLTLWARSEHISEGRTEFRLAAFNGKREVIKFIRFPGDGVTGTTEWSMYRAEMEADSAVALASVDVFHSGNGTVWVDNISIEIAGKRYDPDLYPTWKANQAELQWLKEHAIRLSTDDPEIGFDDLSALQPFFGGAEIIGLGEGTHGTREFFRMKHRLVKWIANQTDTVLFAIEANMPEARAVNRYILTGEGGPKEALAGLKFWVWNTKEVLEMIEWMRRYNQSGQGRIEFWGIDMQYNRAAADSVRAFVRRVDPAYLEKLNELYSGLGTSDELRAIPNSELNKVYDPVSEVLQYLEMNRDRYLAQEDTVSVEWAIQYARIVKQSVGRFMPYANSRDRSMADNVRWIRNSLGKQSKMLIWTHNSHVARERNRMGGYLSDFYGEKYRAVGFAFGGGTYTAVLGPDKPVDTFTAPTPIEGSVEYTLRSLGIPIFAINLIKTSGHPQGSWLNESTPFRNIGSIARNMPYHSVPVARRYDLLIYIDQTTASHSFGRPD